MPRQKYLELAKLVSTQGLKGELRAQYFCDDAESIADYDTLYLGKEKLPIKVISSRQQKNVAIIKLSGVDTIEDARKYIGKTLYLDRNDDSLPEGKFYIADLIGTAVYDVDNGKCYGKIDDVLQNTSTDVYVIKAPGGKELLFPAIPDILINVDIDGDRIEIRPLPGLFENDEELNVKEED